ncbi:uncharacterized protein LOC126897646 isoform X3 [Daktulosphaira vitifoliae]|nr:uncharacterized protein LOC126897646 isoform X3 [Daktulosphaira vitifoliae]XP_050527369.1 uncharacterized protein LOC126897646 isoform X3 [Daktulosphaira vitifoliae]
MDQHNNSIDNVDNGNRCRSPSIRRHDDPSLVIVDVEAAELLQQSAYPTHQQQQLIDEQALLKTVTVNRGAVQQTTSNCYTEYVRIPLTYVIGVPFCWLLLGVFQYFGCVAVLGDNLLDPWYFTCAWLVEIVCTLHAVVIFMIVKCTYVRVRTTKMRKILKRLLGFIIHVCCSVGLFAMCQYLVGIDKQLKSIPYVVLFYYQIIIVTLLLAWKKFIKDWVYGDMDVFTREMAKSQIVEINSNPRIHNRKRRQSIPMITASLQSFENKLNTL